MLAPTDPSPVSLTRPGATCPLVFVCDHAGRAIPRRLEGLGVGAADMERHIAWDLGAGALSAALGETFGASVIAQAYSRLVIDCNRDPAAADAIPRVSDGTAIPGNADLSPDERAARTLDIHAPYHAAIAAELDARAAPVPVFIHSFTPVMRGFARPWRYGVLHEGSSAFALDVLARLQARLGDAVGENEPYAFDKTDYTAPRHAVSRGRPYLELEVRQDLLNTPAGVADVAAFIAGVLRDAV